MPIKKGADRVVVLLPALGLVVKLPIIRVVRFLHSFAGCFKDRRFVLKRLWMGVETPVSYHFGFRGMLFKGLHANWCEFWFYWRTRNAFLQPTYFSFFGLLNIQQMGEPCLLDDVDVWSQLSGLTKRDVWKDSHHFANASNFGFWNGKFRMFDYGSKASREVAALHGAYIVEHFDPTYSWEEVKKRLIAEKEKKID